MSDVVQGQLRVLSQRAHNKSLSVVEKAAELALVFIRNHSNVEELASDTITRPLLLACAAKDKTLTLEAIATIQTLIEVGAFMYQPDVALAAAVGTLRIQAESPDPAILMRILQTLSLISSSHCPSQETLQQCFSICVRLLASQHSSIASATLNHTASLFFEVEDKHAAVLVLRDLSSTLCGESPDWLMSTTSLPKTFVAELLSYVLLNYHTLITSSKPCLDVIRENLCPAIILAFKLGSDFPLMLRLISLITNLVVQYHSVASIQCETLTAVVVRMLEPEFPLWVRVLSLDALRVITRSHACILFLYEPSKGKLLGSITHSLGRFVQYCSQEYGDNSSLDGIWDFEPDNYRSLDLLRESQVPDFDLMFSIMLAIKIFDNIVDFISSHEQIESLPDTVKDVVKIVWCPIHVAFSLLISRTQSEDHIQALLITFMAITRVSGELSLVKPRNEFIKYLCHLALPDEYQCYSSGDDFQLQLPSNPSLRVLSHKNVLSMKVLFNISHCLGHTLGSGWIMLLDTFEHLDGIIESCAEFRNGHSAGKNSASQEDLALLDTALSELFTNSNRLDDTAISHFLYSIGTLLLNSLANSATSGPKSAHLSSRMFLLAKLSETIECNVSRIALLWEFTVGNLNCVISHPDPVLREHGTGCFAKFVKLALLEEFTPVSKNAPTHSQSDEDSYPNTLVVTVLPETRDIFENFILGPLTSLYRSKYADTRSHILVSVFDLIQSCGQRINSGWRVILELLGVVVTSMNTDSDFSPAHRLAFISNGFKCIQLIVDEFLQSMPWTLYEELSTLLGLYGAQRQGTNISFTSIGVLWQLSDHITRERQSSGDSESLDRLQLLIFRQLKNLSLDDRSEVRNSAVQTLYSVIVVYGQSMGASTLAECNSEILLPLVLEIGAPDVALSRGSIASVSDIKGVVMMHHSRDSAQKQWSETRVHLVQGLARVLKQYFFQLSATLGFYNSWKTYLTIFGSLITDMTDETVSLCAIRAVQEILQSPDATAALLQDRKLLDAALNVYMDVVQAALHSPLLMNVSLLTAYLESISQLLKSETSSALFTSEDVLMFLELADRISTLSDINASNTRETPLQHATLQLIGGLSLVSGPSHVWGSVILQVLKYVDSVGPRKNGVFAEKCIPVLVSLFCFKAPVETRASEDLYSSVSTSFIGLFNFENRLSTLAIQAWLDVLESYIDALTVCGTEVDYDSLFSRTCILLRDLLVMPSPSPVTLKGIQQLARCITNVCSKIKPETLVQFIDVVLYSKNSDDISAIECSIRTLFSLCTESTHYEVLFWLNDMYLIRDY